VLNPGDWRGPFVVIHTVEPGSPSATALQLLSVVADQDMAPADDASS
jgi:hypothetical protein